MLPLLAAKAAEPNHFGNQVGAVLAELYPDQCTRRILFVIERDRNVRPAALNLALHCFDRFLAALRDPRQQRHPILPRPIKCRLLIVFVLLGRRYRHEPHHWKNAETLITPAAPAPPANAPDIVVVPAVPAVPTEYKYEAAGLLIFERIYPPAP